MSEGLRKIRCQNCGADLDLASGGRFLTCKYCSSTFEVPVQESAQSIKPEHLAQNIRLMEENLRVLSQAGSTLPGASSFRMKQILISCIVWVIFMMIAFGIFRMFYPYI